MPGDKKGRETGKSMSRFGRKSYNQSIIAAGVPVRRAKEPGLAA
jgi:hypothetical protein